MKYIFTELEKEHIPIICFGKEDAKALEVIAELFGIKKAIGSDWTPRTNTAIFYGEFFQFVDSYSQGLNFIDWLTYKKEKKVKSKKKKQKEYITINVSKLKMVRFDLIIVGYGIVTSYYERALAQMGKDCLKKIYPTSQIKIKKVEFEYEYKKKKKNK